MIDRSQAQRKVSEMLDTHSEAQGDLVVLEGETLECSFGWVFFYQSRRYVETGEWSAALAGNAPYIVNRFTGKLVVTGTASPIDQYIREYEASLDGHPGLSKISP